MHVLFFKAINPPAKPKAQTSENQPAHERLRQLADELERTAAPGDEAGADDDVSARTSVHDDVEGGAVSADAPAGDNTEDGDATDPSAQGRPPAPGLDGGAQPGAADAGQAFGPHNVDAGHHVAFEAGEFSGAGKVTATGEDGCTVQDKTGREHRVHWHEVKGHNDGVAATDAAPVDKKTEERDAG